MCAGLRWPWGARLGWLAPALAALAPVASLEAQTVPPEALRQLDTLIGNRVETLAVLGTQSGASEGAFVFDAGDADSEIDVLRLAWRGDLGSPRVSRVVPASRCPQPRGVRSGSHTACEQGPIFVPISSVAESTCRVAAAVSQELTSSVAEPGH